MSRFAGDADGVMDRGGNVGRGDRVINGVFAACVALANDLAAANAATGYQSAITMLPMVSAVGNSSSLYPF